MAPVVEFVVSTDEFPLGQPFTSIPNVVVELERIVPTDGSVFPYVWIRGGDRTAVTAALEASGATESFTLIDEVADRGLLYRASWQPEVNAIVRSIVGSDVTVLSAIGKRRQWRFRLRADDHEAISQFQDRCREDGVHLSISRLQPLALEDVETEITWPQLEALELAFERGYFDDPRRATLDDLAAELEITRQSVAGRLRRGHRNLLSQLFDTTARSTSRAPSIPGE